MIEYKEILIHLDPKGDRTSDADLKFDGWVAAKQPIKAVWLAAEKDNSLPLCDRPDVRRVFPDRIAVGFSGTWKARDLTAHTLRLGLRIGDETFEVEHPLPAPLPKQSFRERLASALQLSWLIIRERMASAPRERWHFILQRHLLYRKQRSNVFRRAHTEALLADFAVALPEAIFIQIGANDGLTGDPIHHLLMREEIRWRGVLVEPVAHLFAHLMERYGRSPALRLERAAIGESNGVATIHRLRTTAADSLWLQQLASLDPELLRRNARQFGPGEPETISETVPTLDVATLLERHHITELDLIIIDTEGWDWRILRQFDLQALRPQLILYEHQHLLAEEREEAHRFLAGFSYDWAETKEGDTLAWDQLSA